MKYHHLLLLSYLLLSSSSGVYADSQDSYSEDGCGLLDALPYMVAGGGLLALAAPAGLTALGFTSLGITAKSLAASLMSWSAVANGGGVASGGLVATLQSLGTQLSTTTLTSVGAKLGYSYHQNYVCGQKKKKK
ncbi:interferon alpha-inducible protein 6 [Ornithorhynchus anatinus]|uniref:Interferon alpha inducible protein 6 n=1 Tax=Ornithorhynchus anatinus TaxID=9258 RepID=A0A6I8NL25_ORNAN|nr:interferon alpha-inducible protein 6 [Ornithorhynchus anatinus]XP_028936052.1 interferon alpha-inducible protein 6 [Ornithorhynchus anatinus]XP_028936053.1 interferon alpha-inducible protein 6 [Ornithorhynchus anatinus]XP_028936054.1 interferon alpha-inducible protein 6 [Ornithorhynchus anatinus]